MVVSEEGQSTNSCVQLAAQICASEYLPLKGGADASKLWPQLCKVGPVHLQPQ